MNSIKLFESKKIRSVWNEEEQKWYFSIIDIISVLTDSSRPRKYWSDLKKKLFKEGYEQLSEKIGQLKLEAEDGKKYLTDVSDTETLMRLIQSIPSPKAEPFKRWLAKVERLEEIENPELASQRMRQIYKAKGYSDEWIDKRKTCKNKSKYYSLDERNRRRIGGGARNSTQPFSYKEKGLLEEQSLYLMC